MKSTQFCSIVWLEHILSVAKASEYTHFRILPCGSFAGFEFGSSGKRGWYRPSVEDMSITGKECVKYFRTDISWDEYMDIRNKAMNRFYGRIDEEE